MPNPSKKPRRMKTRRRDLNPGLPRDARIGLPLYCNGPAFWTFADCRHESDRVPPESRCMLRKLFMRKTRPGAQSKEMATFGFEPKGLCLRSGRASFTPCALLTSPSCFRAWVPQRLATQPLTTPGSQGRCQLRGCIMKPRRHEHLSGTDFTTGARGRIQL
jgi:hypothetical protein